MLNALRLGLLSAVLCRSIAMFVVEAAVSVITVGLVLMFMICMLCVVSVVMRLFAL